MRSETLKISLTTNIQHQIAHRWSLTKNDCLNYTDTGKMLFFDISYLPLNPIFGAVVLLCILMLTYVARRKVFRVPVPISVNYFFNRKCNKTCGFCFHTAKTSYQAPPEDAKRALSMLKRAGMRKLNFAGGEPFLNPKFLGMLHPPELATACSAA